MLAFERKVTVSRRSLVINLPEDLVRQTNIEKGQKVKILLAGKRKFIVEASG
jgi:antitoxin component of MazEF toxin-antitoxin module